MVLSCFLLHFAVLKIQYGHPHPVWFDDKITASGQAFREEKTFSSLPRKGEEFGRFVAHRISGPWKVRGQRGSDLLVFASWLGDAPRWRFQVLIVPSFLFSIDTRTFPCKQDVVLSNTVLLSFSSLSCSRNFYFCRSSPLWHPCPSRVSGVTKVHTISLIPELLTQF
jgi:hypothetical protein